MSNYFDQFDEPKPQRQPNFFDQFDADPKPAAPVAPAAVASPIPALLAADPARETTWGEFGTGLALDVLGIGPQRAVKGIADLGDLFGVPGAQAASDFFQRGIEAAEELKPEAYAAQQRITAVEQDEDGNITGLRAPSAEAMLGLVGSSAAQLPFFLSGGGALRNLAAKGLGALGYTGRGAQTAAAAAGYGGVNAALVAPSEADAVYREAYKEALDGQLGAIMFNGGTPTPEQIAAAEAVADAKAREAESTALSMLVPLTAATGAIPGAMALRGAQSSNSMLGAMLRGGAADAPFEFAEESGTSAIQDTALGREVNLANALDAGLMATASGALQGATLGGAEFRGQRAAEAKLKAAQAQFDVEAAAAAEAAGGTLTVQQARSIAERAAKAHGVTADQVLRGAPAEAAPAPEAQAEPGRTVSEQEAVDIARRERDRLRAKRDGTPGGEVTDPLTGERRSVEGQAAEFLTDRDKAVLDFLEANADNPEAVASALGARIAPPATPEADEAASNDIMEALLAAGIEPPPVPEQGGNPEPVAPAAGSQPAAAVSPLAEQFNQPAPSSSVASVERPQQVQAVTGQAVPNLDDEISTLVAKREAGSLTPEESSQLTDLLLRSRVTNRVGGRPLDGVLNMTAKADKARRGELLPVQGFLDADDFKNFNDLMGHDTGDQVIRDMASALQAVLGPDNVFHRGGDEFEFQGTDEATVQAAIEQARQQLAGMTYTFTRSDGSVIETRGVGFSSGLGADITTAEAAQYADKEQRKAAGLRRGVRGPDRRNGVAPAGGTAGEAGPAPDAAGGAGANEGGRVDGSFDQANQPGTLGQGRGEVAPGASLAAQFDQAPPAAAPARAAAPPVEQTFDVDVDYTKRKPKKKSASLKPLDGSGKPRSLLDWIAHGDGLDRDTFARELGIGPKELGRKAAGRPIFRKRVKGDAEVPVGMTPDEFREWLQTNDYVPRDQDDRPAEFSVDDAMDMFDRAFRGGQDVFSYDQLPAVQAWQAARRGEVEQDSQGDDAPAEPIIERLPEAVDEAIAAGVPEDVALDAWNRATDINDFDARIRALIDEAGNDDFQGAEGGGREADPQGLRPRGEDQGEGGGGDGEARGREGRAGDLFAAPTAREQVRAAQEQRDARRDGRTGSGRTDMLAGDGELFAGPRPEQTRVDESPRPTSDAEWLSLAEAASPPVRGVDDLRQFLQVRRHPEIEAAFEGLGGGSVDAVASNVARRIWDSSIPFRNLDTPGQPASETATPFGEASASTRFQPLAELPATRGDGTPRRGLVQMQKALAQRLGRGLTPQDNAALVAFMDRFADHLGDIGLSFRRGAGAQGQFIPEAGVVEIFSRAIEEGSVKRTTIHEFWHALARHLTDAQVEAVRSAYRRGKSAWRKANPELSGFMDQRDWTLRGPAAEAWMRDTKGARGHESAERVIVQRDDAGRVQSVRLARTDETYRYTNVDEFFAEEMADRTESAYESAEARGVLNAARKVLADLWYMLRRIIGRAEVDRLFRDYMGGRVDSTVRRRSVAESAGEALSARESARGERSIEHEGETFVRRGRDYLLADEAGEPRDFASADAAEAEAERLGGEVLQDAPGDGPRTWSVRLPAGVARDAERALMQRKDVPQAQAEAVQKRRIADSGLGNPMNGGAMGWQVRAAKWIGSREAVRKARAIFQDKMIALRDTQQDIEAALGRALPDLQNAYQVENLMHGRVQRETESLDDRLFDPLFDALRAAKVTVKQFEEYLYARHAKERNREIAAINPRMPDGGSGMSNADADRILAASDRAVMEPLARRVDAIVAETRKRMLDSGVITREVYDALTSQYQHYVPLRGKDESKALAERSGAGLGGGGLDLRNAGLKGALGRATLATNLLGEVIGDAQRSVVLAEKARVGRSLARLVLANPNPAFWQMEAVRTEQAKDSQGQVYQRVMDESSQPDVMHVMVNGKPYRIRFADQNLADALRNIGGTGKFITLPVIRQLASFQRYIAATLTAWNPGFTAVNIARDLQFGLARIGSEHGLRDAARVLGGYPSAIRAMWRLERKKGARQNSRMDRYANEFEAAGGKTGWMHVASVDALTKSAAWKSSGSPLADARRAGEAILKAIEDLNDTFENAMRLSYYARLRDGGMSAQQAASKAKDLTVNFNRKGYAGPAMSAGYLFFNAAVQGTHALGRSVDPSKPAGRKILAGLTGLSVLQFMLAAIASGMEDDEGESYASKVPPQIKERNLWMVGSDGQVYTIPMPFGFNIATYAGSRMQQLLSSDADDIASGAKTTGQVASAATSDLFRVAISAVFPVQIAQSGLASIIPTELGQHIIQQTANANDFGQQIWAKNPYDRVTPASMLGRDATPEGYKAIATMLNRAGGGDDFTKPGIGMLDVAPEQVQFFVEFLTGGTGRFFGGLAQTGYNVAFDPEANEQRPTPIVQTFMRPVNEVQATAQRYYARRESIEVAADRIRTIANTEGVAAALDYADTLPFMAGVSVKLDRSGQAEIRAGNSTVYAAFKEAEKAGEAFRDERQQVYAEDSAMFSATRAAKLREASKAQMEAQKAMLAEWNAATEGWAE